MSGPQEFNISFRQSGTDYNLKLVKGTQSDHSVTIKGIQYAVLGDDEAKLKSACDILSSVSLDSIYSQDDLKDRLALVKNISFPQQVSEVGISVLHTQSNSPKEIDIKAASEAYLLATDKPQDSHASVGILRPNGQTIDFHLGKDEDYGAHRIGSVTKTFTTFLALKLVKDGVISLDTKCGDLITDESILKGVFAEPEKAKKMTLEQLLSHTSGLEYEDRPQGGVKGDDSAVKLPTLEERFIHQEKLDYRYKHEHSPGDGTALYSNIGFDVAAWMMEIAYNKTKSHEAPKVPFSQIIKDELFTKVFNLSEDTRISPGASGNGDVIQAGCGDMVSSIQDLLQVAQTLQKGEENLSSHFGEGWHKTMLTQRASDGKVEISGLGCEPNVSSIQFSGLNCEIFEGGEERDVTAHVAFPLQKDQPGLVAMCDTNALGPEPNQVKFRQELRKLAGLSIT